MALSNDAHPEGFLDDAFVHPMSILSLPSLPLQAFNPDLFAENWTAVAISAVVAALAIGGMFAASRMLSSRRHSDIKLTSYEWGIPPTSYS